MNNTPKEIVDYVIAHINDRPRTDVARHCGISIATVYNIVHKHGGEIRTDLQKKDGIEDKVRELYPVMSARDVAKRLGVSKTTVIRWAERLGCQHTPETLKRLQYNSRHNINYANRKIDYKATAAKRSRTRRLDEWRVKSGLPQKSKLRIRVIPNRTYKAMWYLAKKYNYFFELDSNMLCYDSETRRLPEDREKYFAERYHVRFVQADE